MAIGKEREHIRAAVDNSGKAEKGHTDDAQIDQLEPYISSSATAAALCIKTATLAKKRAKGDGPRGYIATGKTRGVYPVSEVVKYLRDLKEKGNRK
jgi:hypothetical protein